jgi:hypothetical protein
LKDGSHSASRVAGEGVGGGRCWMGSDLESYR